MKGLQGDDEGQGLHQTPPGTVHTAAQELLVHHRLVASGNNFGWKTPLRSYVCSVSSSSFPEGLSPNLSVLQASHSRQIW